METFRYVWCILWLSENNNCEYCGMNHGRHLAEVLDWNGLGMERICHYWRRHLSSVSKSMGFRSVKKCALAEGQLASIAFLMSLSTLHPYMNCCRSPTKYKQLARRRNTIYSMHHRRILTHLAGSQERVSPGKIM